MMNPQGQMSGDQNLFLQMMMAQYQQQSGMQDMSPQQQQQMMGTMMMNMNPGMMVNQPQDSKKEENTE